MEINKNRRKAALIFCIFFIIREFFSLIATIAIMVISGLCIKNLHFEFLGVLKHLTAIALYLKVLLPFPKKHQQTMIIILSLLLSISFITFVHDIVNSNTSFTVDKIESYFNYPLIYIVIYTILLFGLLYKKNTEKIAGIIIIFIGLISFGLTFQHNLDFFNNFSIGINLDFFSELPPSLFMFLYYFIFIFMGILPNLLLLIYPVLSMPILKNQGDG